MSIGINRPLSRSEKMKIYYCRCKEAINNAGDIFTSWLLTKMGYDWQFSVYPDLCSTGSILDHEPCRYAKIWGSGFHNEDDAIVQTDLSKYYAVRGKLSFQKLETKRIIAIGDTGILASRYFDGSGIKKKYRYGIIPHYIDYDFFKQFDSSDCHVIKMDTPDLDGLFKEINECGFILSSSLHGIIFSHSFQLPALHVVHNDLYSRNSFKFKDYYSSFDLPYEFVSINSEQDFYELDLETLYNSYKSGEKSYGPTMEQVKQMQNDLLASFPYQGPPWVHNAIFYIRQKTKSMYHKMRGRR